VYRLNGILQCTLSTSHSRSIGIRASLSIYLRPSNVHFKSWKRHITPTLPRTWIHTHHARWQVRETSRKPDEMYSLLERLSPGTRKLEIFARQHNVQKGWVSLGNQLKGNRLKEPEMLARYEAKYGALADSVAWRVQGSEQVVGTFTYTFKVCMCCHSKAAQSWLSACKSTIQFKVK